MRFFLIAALSLLSISAAEAKNTTYDNPRFYSNGLPIDWCLYPAKQCGEAAAQYFCKSMNAGSAISFKGGRVNSRTYIQGTGTICSTKEYDHCDAFIQIVCGYYTW